MTAVALRRPRRGVLKLSAGVSCTFSTDKRTSTTDFRHPWYLSCGSPPRILASHTARMKVAVSGVPHKAIPSIVTARKVLKIGCLRNGWQQVRIWLRQFLLHQA